MLTIPLQKAIIIYAWNILIEVYNKPLFNQSLKKFHIFAARAAAVKETAAKKIAIKVKVAISPIFVWSFAINLDEIESEIFFLEILLFHFIF